MRSIDGTFLAALTGPSIRPIFLFEGSFQYDVLRLWTGSGLLSWNSQTWLGNGYLGLPVIAEETIDATAGRSTIVLSGVAQNMISLVLANSQRGGQGKLYLAALDSTGAIIGTPLLTFSGKLDSVQIDESGPTASITLNYESDLIDFQRPRSYRFTKESQKLFYADDLGFDYIPSLQAPIFWGVKKKRTRTRTKRSAK